MQVIETLRAVRLLGGVSAVMLIGLGAQAHAATAGAADASVMPAQPETLGEVVVTAQRRGAQNVMSIPAAVDAYSGQQLQDLHVQSVQGLGKIDPSVNVQSFGADEERVIIRGISSSIGSTTGIYLDEAPQVGGFRADINGDSSPIVGLHDLDHVEVLKGPQGTLFGAGSMDGTLRIITRKPVLNAFQGSFEADAGYIASGSGLFNGEAVANAPLVQDKLGMRAVIWGTDRGGYIDQTISGVTRKNVNALHQSGGRFEILFKPMDDFSVLGSATYQHTTVDGVQRWSKFVGPNAAPGGPLTGPYPVGTNYEPTQSPYSNKYALFTLTADYDLHFGTVVATYSHGQKDQVDIYDTSSDLCSFDLCEGSPAFPVVFSNDSHFHDDTAELRFSSSFQGPLQFVAGGYYERDYFDWTGAVIRANAANGVLPCSTYAQCADSGLIQPGLFVSPLEFSQGELFDVNQHAFYGQADFKVLPTVTLTAGIRYFEAHLNDVQITQQDIAPSILPDGSFDGGYVSGEVTTPYISSTGKSRESATTYNFALLWEPSDNLSFYARAASGFRIGGINGTATIAAQEGVTVPGTFGPDSLWDYEVGAKAWLFDRRLFLDTSYYHINWSSQQEIATAGAFPYTLNVGSSHIDGVEVSAKTKPAAGLSIGADLTYVNAVLAKDFPDSVAEAGTPGHADDRLPFVPKLSVSLNAQYEREMKQGVVGYVQGDLAYRSDSFTAFEQREASFGPTNYARLPPYFLMNMAVGARWDRYDMSLFIDNVTDNRSAAIGGFADISGFQIYPPPPITVGLRLRANFE